MWRFVQGVENLAKRLKTDNNEDKRERDKQYDKESRNRTFLEKWKCGRPWLNFNLEVNTMFCSICREHSKTEDEKKSSFVVGCSNLRLETIVYHETKSQIHQKCLTTSREFSKPKGQSSASKIVMTLNEKVVGRMSVLFRNVHALVKMRRPFRDYMWMVQLDAKKGIDVGQTYLNDKEAQVFSEFIAQCARNKLEQKIKSAPFISIITDGSSDKGFREQEVVYVRTAIGGQICTSFLGMTEVSRANADGILGAIDNAFASIAIPDYKSKLVGFGSDGAAVNTGKNNGVIARFRESQNCLVGIHCHAHRLELAYKAAIAKKTMHAKVEELLTGLYYFYRNSPLNRSDLLGACEVLGITKIVPTRVGGTRWLAHWQRALDNLWKSYPAIVSHLQTLTKTDQASPRRHEATGKATGYLKMLLDLHLVNYAHFLTDVINLLSKLSLFLQNESCLVSEVYLRVLATIGVLEQLKLRDGPRLKKFLQDIGNGPIKEFHGFALKEPRSPTSVLFSLDAREDTISSLIQHLDTRFDKQQCDILKATQFADFHLWPRDSNHIGFGDEGVTTLLEHFSPVMTMAGFYPDKVEEEWQLLKSLIYTCGCQLENLKWCDVNKKFQEGHTNILALVDIVLTLPASSADAERGFSEMKMTKSDWRCRLRSNVLNDLLTIHFLSEDIADYDPVPAIYLWNSCGPRQRRPLYMDDYSESDGEDYELGQTDGK